MSPAGIVIGSLYALASAILEPGGGFLYNGTNIFPDDLYGANTKSSLNFSHIPLGLLVYFFHTGTGPPDMAKCGAFSLC